MKRIINTIKQYYAVWKYTKYLPWFKKHKNSLLFKYLEKANWFPWYGKRVVYVKAKDSSDLSHTEKDIKKAINEKNYTKALDIISKLPQTDRLISLKQIIETKIKHVNLYGKD